MKRSTKLSKRNQRGLWVLVILMFCVVIAPRVLTIFKQSDSFEIASVDMNAYMQTIDKKRESHSNYQRKESYAKKSKFHRPTSAFNPNDYTLTDWQKLGLSEKQSAVVLKFTKRGIYSNDELKQVFVINDELFNLIKDSTIYSVKPERYPNNYEKKEYQSKTTSKTLDLNTATIEEFESLKGIGPFYAKKIVEYRDQLGGYTSEEQLLDIWKFDDEKLGQLKPSIQITTTKIRKLNINTATAEELKAHPYISWNIANSIVKMRVKFNKYSNFEQLLESELIDKQLLKKLQPYLTLE